MHGYHTNKLCIGIHITGIQSGEPILIGGSVTITCTTDSPADSIMLLQDDQPKAQQLSTTTLMYTIYFVTDSIHGNIFKCEALLTGRTDTSDTAFESLTLSIKGIIKLAGYSMRFINFPCSSPTTYYY